MRAPGPGPQAPELREVSIAVIGGGTMGQAFVRGLRAAGLPARRLRVAEPRAALRARLRARYGVRTASQAADLLRGTQVVILAVKPQQLADVAADLAPRLTARQLVLSIAAGRTLRWLQAQLPASPIVRAMPNLPATVGQGFAAMAVGRRVSAAHRRTAAAILGAVGHVVQLSERQLDAITAVSGSGPAYVFFLVDAWERAAQALGLSRATAAAAVRQTLRGSLALLKAESAPTEKLIRRVASKGGTTEAALRVLARRRVAAHFTDALRAAARRAKALAR